MHRALLITWNSVATFAGMCALYVWPKRHDNKGWRLEATGERDTLKAPSRGT